MWQVIKKLADKKIFKKPTEGKRKLFLVRIIFFQLRLPNLILLAINFMWDVKEPTHCSKRVSGVVPDVVVYLSSDG